MLVREPQWTPLSVALRTPTASQLAEQFAAAQAWSRQWRQVDPRLFRLDYKTVGGRIIGNNELPCRVWIDSQRQLWAVLGVTRQVQRFVELMNATRPVAPAIVDWMVNYPTKVLAHADQWTNLVEAVVWIDRNAQPEMYLRQIDVPGVDTKFLESNRRIVAELLDRQLSDDRIDRTYPPAKLDERYRFTTKPSYVRLRTLGRTPSIFAPFTELTLRVNEFAATPVQASAVYVVENETTYLAFPEVEDAVVIFGGGYGLPQLAPLQWLHSRQLIYWGDIDTHGFSILNRLRQVFPHARSMLMDRETLLAHHTQWVREPSPTKTALPLLDSDEAALYQDLVDDSFGPSLRLEQERVRFSAITNALHHARA